MQSVDENRQRGNGAGTGRAEEEVSPYNVWGKTQVEKSGEVEG